jgi:hypothetical protein
MLQNLAADSIDSELTGSWSKLHYDGSEEVLVLLMSNFVTYFKQNYCDSLLTRHVISYLSSSISLELWGHLNLIVVLESWKG